MNNKWCEDRFILNNDSVEDKKLWPTYTNRKWLEIDSDCEKICWQANMAICEVLQHFDKIKTHNHNNFLNWIWEEPKKEKTIEEKEEERKIVPINKKKITRRKKKALKFNRK